MKHDVKLQPVVREIMNTKNKEMMHNDNGL